MKIHSIVVGVILVVASVLVADNVQGQNKATGERPGAASEIGTGIDAHVHQMLKTGRRAFRFDTFGSEAFWGETLQLHKAIAGEKNDLDDPATTLALLRLNAVVGVTGLFNKQGNLTSMGLQCALCHSAVDDSFAPGIGKRQDGWANRDLNVGLIVSLSPNLTPFADLLGVDVATVKKVLTSWGPGRFDAELDKDAAARGVVLFNGTAKCATCHVPPLFTEPGNNLHAPGEIPVDSFQADRSPTHMYRTAPLAGLWTHQKGGSLRDVLEHYDALFKLGLSEPEKTELTEYLKSL